MKLETAISSLLVKLDRASIFGGDMQYHFGPSLSLDYLLAGIDQSGCDAHASARRSDIERHDISFDPVVRYAHLENDEAHQFSRMILGHDSKRSSSLAELTDRCPCKPERRLKAHHIQAV